MEHDGLVLNDVVLLFAGSSTPEVDEPDAPVGSNYFRSNGDRYVRTANTGSGVAADWELVPIVSGGGPTVQLDWEFKSATGAADPGSGNFRYNNATPASVTAIYISDETKSGIDVGTIIGLLSAGNKIYIQQFENSTKAQLFDVTSAPTDNSGWWTIPVTLDANGTGGLPDDGKECLFLFFGGGGGGTPSDQPTVMATRSTAVTFTTAWTDVTLDQTPEENAPATVEHDNTNTDRLLLKDAGIYEIHYRIDVDIPAGASNFHYKVGTRVRADDAGADLPGSECVIDAHDDSSLDGDQTIGEVLTGTFDYTSAGGSNFLSLQVQKVEIAGPGETVNGRANGIVFKATRKTGVKGDQGDQGPGGGPTETARVTHSVNQSVPDGTFTALAFDTEDFDTDTMHDTVTNNSRLTATTAGKYLVGGTANFAASGTGRREVRIRKNGTDYIAAMHTDPGGGIDCPLSVSTEVELAVNDYVEFIAWQSSGVGLDVTASTDYSPIFWAHRQS